MRAFVVPLLIAVLALLATAPAWDGAFIYDDQYYVVENPAVRGDASPWTSPLGEESQALWRPVTIASFRAQWETGTGAGPFRAVNILLHVLTALAVLALGRSLGLSAPGRFIAAALFAVHPVHAEAVAWVSGRAELLAALFVCCAWIAHRSERTGSGWLAALCLAVACLSKENAFVAPALFIAADLGLGRRPRPWARWGGLTVVVVALFTVRLELLPQALPGLSPFGDLSLTERLPVAARILGTSLRLLTWPAPLRVHYHRDEFLGADIAPLLWLGAGALALAVALFADRRALVTLLLVPVAMATTLNLVPIGATFAERFLYLPSIPFCLGIGALLAAWSRREARRAALGTSLAVLIVVLALAIPVSRQAVRVLHDDLTLWAHAAGIAPRNPHVRYNHGYFLHENGRHEREAPDRPASGEELWASLHLDPGHLYAGFAHNMLGVQAMEARDRWIPDLPSAAYHFREAARRINLPDPVINLAMISLAVPDIVPREEAFSRLQQLYASPSLDAERRLVVDQLVAQIAAAQSASPPVPPTGTSSDEGS